MSGAGGIKGDGSTADTLYEIKDAKKSYTLSVQTVSKHYREAARVGKEAVLTVEFGKYTVDCRITKNY